MSLSSDAAGPAAAEFTAGFHTSEGDAWDPDVSTPVGTLTEIDMPELRAGEWTRYGDGSLLGDAVTERVLGGIAEEARAAATAQGYAVGWAQGRREAEQAAALAAAAAEKRRQAEEDRRDSEHMEALAALARAAEDVRDLLAGLCHRVESEGTALAWAVTEALVGREVRSLTGPDVVRRVLAVLPPNPVCTVRLHPDIVDSAAVAELRDRGLEVVTDRTLSRGDALVESDGSVIDLRIDEALNRVREALSE